MPMNPAQAKQLDKRNDKIFKDFQMGMTKAEISTKYKLTYQRISDIIKEEQIVEPMKK